MSAKKLPEYDGKSLPFAIGDKIFIRTVTHHQVGKLIGIGVDFFVLANASWVADSGRFGDALKNGTLNEVEKCPGPWCVVGRGGVIDIHPWDHDLPAATK